MERVTAGELLNQLRQMEAAAKSTIEASVSSQESQANFSGMLQGALDKVNELQKTSSEMATALEMGDKSVSLVQAMIAAQKSSVAFQATLQVRNKLVSAYQDIMNMPI